MASSKKLKRIILPTIIWAIIILLSKWFNNELCTLITPFRILIPIIILFLWTIGFLVWSIIFFIKWLKSYKWKAIIPLGIVIFVVFIYIYIPFHIVKMKLEHYIYSDNRVEVVSMVKSGEIIPDGLHNAELPKGYKRTSIDGEIHIYENSQDNMIVGFWVFRGLMVIPYTTVIYTTYDYAPTEDQLGGRIYSVVPLQEHWYYVHAN